MAVCRILRPCHSHAFGRFLGFKQKQNQDVPIKQTLLGIAWVTVAVLFGGGCGSIYSKQLDSLPRIKNHGILCRLSTGKITSN